MEVVIGAMLLVGAFALGHNTADQDANQAAGDQSVVASQERFLSTDCRYRMSGSVQRDLTLPYSQQRLAERAGSDAARVAYRGD